MYEKVIVPDYPDYFCLGPEIFSTRRLLHVHKLKPWLNKGYLQVQLHNSSGVKKFSVHKIVALCYLGPCPNGMEVCHGPGGRLDNRPENLSYGTKEDNYGRDRRRDGTMPEGEKCHLAKLTNEQVLEFRRLATSGLRIIEISKMFPEVKYDCIRDIVAKKTWRHLREKSEENPKNSSVL